MKTFLLSCALLATIFSCHQLSAQCTVSTPTISNIQRKGCTFTFDLSFSLKGNGGNKITTVYIYNTNDYNALPTSFYGTNNNKVPSSSDLDNGKALATIKVNTDSTVTMFNYQKVSNKFESPASMKPQLPFKVDALGQVTVRNISLDFVNCNSLISLKADILSSQSPDLSSVGCIVRGMTFTPNEPIIRVQNKDCSTERSLITTFITTQERTINFKLYKDVAPFGIFTEADTVSSNAVSDPYTATTTATTSEEFRIVGNYSYQLQLGEQANVWVVAYTSGVSNASVALAENSCAPLPTKFRSVAAQRVKENVFVKWETATEENNRGFNVQRQIGSGEWENLAFIGSRAQNGTSSNTLSYSYNDVNTVRGISQYRIQQVSLDGKITYSAIRSVRSEDIPDKVSVYPNPSSNGKVTIAFDASNSAREIVISDFAGRVVKRFSGIKDNSIVIENLTTGLYTIKITNQTTSTVSIEKVVVNSR